MTTFIIVLVVAVLVVVGLGYLINLAVSDDFSDLDDDF